MADRPVLAWQTHGSLILRLRTGIQFAARELKEVTVDGVVMQNASVATSWRPDHVQVGFRSVVSLVLMLPSCERVG
jgi:hypothetical protein